MEVTLGTHRAEAVGFVGLFLLPFPCCLAYLLPRFVLYCTSHVDNPLPFPFPSPYQGLVTLSGRKVT